MGSSPRVARRRGGAPSRPRRAASSLARRRFAAFFALALARLGSSEGEASRAAAPDAPASSSLTALTIPLMTRDAVAARADTYTYAHARMPDAPHHVVRFEPKADMATVHHMLLFGCEGDVSPHLKTRSGGMFTPAGDDASASASASASVARGAVCLGDAGEPFIFGWGMNAPDLVMPAGVGFRVGGNNEGAIGGGANDPSLAASFSHLVLEVHYLDPQPNSSTASSGLIVHLEPGVPDRAASVMAFAQGFVLPPGVKRATVRNSCCYAAARPLVAFAFRVHAHALGREVFLERMPAGGGYNTNARGGGSPKRTTPSRTAAAASAARRRLWTRR